MLYVWLLPSPKGKPQIRCFKKTTIQFFDLIITRISSNSRIAVFKRKLSIWAIYEGTQMGNNLDFKCRKTRPERPAPNTIIQI